MSEKLSLKVKNAIEESVKLKELVLQKDVYRILVEMGEVLIESFLNGGKVLISGNGYSATNVQHLTSEFLIKE